MLCLVIVRAPTLSGIRASRSATAPAVNDGCTPPDEAWAWDGASDGALDCDGGLLEADAPHATRTRPAAAVTAMVLNRFNGEALQLVGEWWRIPDPPYL